MKARAKLVNSPKWVYGEWLGEAFFIQDDIGQLSQTEVELSTVGLSTGMVDKYDTKIYQGDLVLLSDGKLVTYIPDSSNNGLVWHKIDMRNGRKTETEASPIRVLANSHLGRNEVYQQEIPRYDASRLYLCKNRNLPYIERRSGQDVHATVVALKVGDTLQCSDEAYRILSKKTHKKI